MLIEELFITVTFSVIFSPQRVIVHCLLAVIQQRSTPVPFLPERRLGYRVDENHSRRAERSSRLLPCSLIPPTTEPPYLLVCLSSHVVIATVISSPPSAVFELNHFWSRPVIKWDAGTLARLCSWGLKLLLHCQVSAHKRDEESRRRIFNETQPLTFICI